MSDQEYKVIHVNAYYTSGKSSDGPIHAERLALPISCPPWLEDLACFGLAYSKWNLNNKDHYILKTYFDEKEKKWFGHYLGHQPPLGCGCGSKE